jgi:subtilisin family serine protease
MLRINGTLTLAVLFSLTALSCNQTLRSQQGKSLAAFPLEAQDTFCQRPVRDKEIIFRQAHCSEDADVKDLGDRLTSYLNERTKKADMLAVSRVASNCYFLARSSTRKAAELVDTFQEEFVGKLNLNSAQENEVKALAVVDFEPNYLIQLDNTAESVGLPAVHDTSSDWWFGNPPGSNAAAAWSTYGRGSADVVVGILDTGIRYDHPELRPNVWTATAPIDLPADGVNCRVGDHGIDISGPTATCNPEDKDGHGTHVAGIIGASGKAAGVVGVSPNAQLLAIKIFDTNGLTYLDRVIRAIDIAVQLKAKYKINVRVLNNSYNVDVPCDAAKSTLRSKIQEAADEDILLVAAAGQSSDNGTDLRDNDQLPRFISFFNSADNVISVTAVDMTGSFTKANLQIVNYGKQRVDLGAPGSQIYSTDIAANGNYYQRSLTSMATPFVSGAAALMMALPYCKALKAADVKALILAGAATAPALADKTVTGGTLDVYSSVRKCPKSP